MSKLESYLEEVEKRANRSVVWLGLCADDRPTGALYDYDPTGIREEGTVEHVSVKSYDIPKLAAALRLCLGALENLSVGARPYTLDVFRHKASEALQQVEALLTKGEE
jgi:hypothetical protein